MELEINVKSNGTNEGSSTNGTRLLEGQSVLVTGGSGGIGQGICEVAAREGAQVAFTWRGNEAGAEETKTLIRQHGGECLAIQSDLRERDAAAHVVATIEEAWGCVDTLINNAAISEAVPFILLDDDDFADMMELNLFAAFRMCRAAVRGMIRRKYGRIVNISSMAAQSAITRVLGYSMAKAAIDNYTRWLCVEAAKRYGSRIRVNAIAPGFFVTHQNRRLLTNPDGSYTSRGQAVIANTPFNRFGEPQELIGALVWLLSDASAFVSGEVICVDGGFHIFSGV